MFSSISSAIASILSTSEFTSSDSSSSSSSYSSTFSGSSFSLLESSEEELSVLSPTFSKPLLRTFSHSLLERVRSSSFSMAELAITLIFLRMSDFAAATRSFFSWRLRWAAMRAMVSSSSWSSSASFSSSVFSLTGIASLAALDYSRASLSRMY